MINISIVGRVVDRPFRPGNAQRVVLKIDADDERGRTQHLELDAFGEIGDWVMKNVTVGETLAVNARLELRTYMDHGEEVDELRLVAIRFEPLQRRGGGDRGGDRERGGFNRRDREGGRDRGRGSFKDPNAAEPQSGDHEDDDDSDAEEGDDES